jgi:tetratricopeptide (TPR) repeat protein
MGEGRRPAAPPLPDDVDPAELDRDVQRELAALPSGLAELIAKHLVAAARFADENPERALEHARFVRTRAARIPVVREAAGVVAYRAEEWAEALSELRAARRLGGGPGLLAIMADCERALGRPERALEIARSAEAAQLAPEDAAELRIVAAGARRDLGQPEAAVVALQGPDLDMARHDPWSARLFYVYADNLAAAGRTEEAARWFVAAADADEDAETDAAQRAAELGAGTS